MYGKYNVWYTGMASSFDGDDSPKTGAPEIEYVFKILLIGDAGVGKSGLLMRFADNKFTENYNTTVGVEFKFRTIEVDGKSVKLQVWDTSGQERFRAITANYYRNIHGIMIVYDISNHKSFHNVDLWLDEIDRNTTQEASKILIGNKCDLDHHAVNTRTAQAYANDLQMPFLETSVKEDIRIEDAFTTLARHILKRTDFQKTVHGYNGYNYRLSPPNNNRRKRGCCNK